MRRETTVSGDGRAVSEAISYVLVFGVMILGTSLVALQSAPVLTDTQGRQVAENAERAIHLVQDRVAEMAQRNAPRREISLDVQELTVGVGGFEPTHIRVEATNTSGDTLVLADLDVDPVYLKTEAGRSDQTAVYENGAVLFGKQGEPGTWTMTSRPSWAITTNRSTGKVRSVFLRTISTTGEGSVSGRRTKARILFETVSRETGKPDGVTEIEVSVESPRSGAWEEYLGRLRGSVAGGDVTTSGDTVTLTMDEFEDGEGRLNHVSHVISTEVEAGAQ